MLSLSIIFGSAILPDVSSSPLTESAYADPSDDNNNSGDQQDRPSDEEGNENGDQGQPEDTDEGDDEEEKPNVCQGQAGSVSWMLCPLLNAASGLVDSIYGLINNLLVIQPISTDHDSAIYKV